MSYTELLSAIRDEKVDQAEVDAEHIIGRLRAEADKSPGPLLAELIPTRMPLDRFPPRSGVAPLPSFAAASMALLSLVSRIGAADTTVPFDVRSGLRLDFNGNLAAATAGAIALRPVLQVTS